MSPYPYMYIGVQDIYSWKIYTRKTLLPVHLSVQTKIISPSLNPQKVLVGMGVCCSVHSDYKRPEKFTRSVIKFTK